MRAYDGAAGDIKKILRERKDAGVIARRALRAVREANNALQARQRSARRCRYRLFSPPRYALILCAP